MIGMSRKGFNKLAKPETSATWLVNSKTLAMLLSPHVSAWVSNSALPMIIDSLWLEGVCSTHEQYLWVVLMALTCLLVINWLMLLSVVRLCPDASALFWAALPWAELLFWPFWLFIAVELVIADTSSEGPAAKVSVRMEATVLAVANLSRWWYTSCFWADVKFCHSCDE